QAPARAFHYAVDLRKDLFDLRFEIIDDIIALAVLRGGLSGNPDDHSAERDHARRNRAPQLERRLLHILARPRGARKQDGQKDCSNMANVLAPANVGLRKARTEGSR